MVRLGLEHWGTTTKEYGVLADSIRKKHPLHLLYVQV